MACCSGARKVPDLRRSTESPWTLDSGRGSCPAEFANQWGDARLALDSGRFALDVERCLDHGHGFGCDLLMSGGVGVVAVGGQVVGFVIGVVRSLNAARRST